MSDIVERLTLYAEYVQYDPPINYEDRAAEAMREAADEIVRLRAEVHYVNKAMDLTVRKIIKVEAERDRLREALLTVDHKNDATLPTYNAEIRFVVRDALKGGTP